MITKGFYAVLDRDDEQLARTLAAYACALQVRIKPCDTGELVRIARMARGVCDDAGIPLVVNDRIDVALAACADGVHLGQTDLPIDAARELAGDKLFVGVSTHDVAQVERAVAAGADYLGFGPIFDTRTKDNPDPVQGIAGLRAAVAAARGVPIVAIGGITPQVARDICAAGASCLCAIGSVNHASDVAAVAQLLRDVAR